MDVAVLGAGSVGRGIAELSVLAGHDVRLQGGDANDVMDAIDGIEHGLRDAVEAGDIARETRAAALDRVDATTGLEAAVAGVDLVVETTGGDVATVRSLFADVEELADREAMIATGAAEGRLTAIAAGLRHPDRALGIYFRSPLDAELVEVVAAEQTAGGTTDRATAFVRGLERHPILVRDVHGRVAPRLALAQEVEAMRLVEGAVAAVPDVDDAMVLGYDHSTGPLERADRAGLADRLETLEGLAASLGPHFDPPAILRERVADGKTGAAVGEGFYVWENGTPTEGALPAPNSHDRRTGPDDPGVR